MLLTVNPPPLMAQSMAQGNCDAFCVDEPWNMQVTLKDFTGRRCVPANTSSAVRPTRSSPAASPLAWFPAVFCRPSSPACACRWASPDRVVMMNNGPRATIGRILDIEWPRPRDRVAFMESPAYTHYRTECMRFLFWRHGTPPAATPAPEPAPTATNPRLAEALGEPARLSIPPV